MGCVCTIILYVVHKAVKICSNLDKEADPRGFLMEQSKIAGVQWKKMDENEKKVIPLL